MTSNGNSEQIARMLAIERGDDLAGIKVSEADDRHFGQPEFFLHRRRHGSDGGLVNTTTQYRRDLRIVGADDQLGYPFFALRRARAYTRAGNPALDFFRDPVHRRIDLLE